MAFKLFKKDNFGYGTHQEFLIDNIEDLEELEIKFDCELGDKAYTPDGKVYARHSDNYQGDLWELVFDAGGVFFSDLKGMIEGSLTSITIPDGVTRISSFRGCNLLETVLIPNTVTSIETNAFSGCSALKNINIPNSVTSLGNNVFHSCSALKSIVIPDSITEILTMTFYGCTGLESVFIPASVTSISNTAFYNVTGTIYCEFSEGDVSGAPWGATGATIVYDYTPE